MKGGKTERLNARSLKFWPLCLAPPLTQPNPKKRTWGVVWGWVGAFAVDGSGALRNSLRHLPGLRNILRCHASNHASPSGRRHPMRFD